MTVRLFVAIGAALGLLVTGTARADANRDHRLRVSAGANIPLSDAIDANLTQHLRTSLHGEAYRRAIPELELNGTVARWLSLGASGRVTWRFDAPNYQIWELVRSTERSWRLSANATLRSPDIGPFSLRYRGQFDRTAYTEKDDVANRLRHRISARVATPSIITPELFGEWFVDPTGEGDRPVQDQRLGGGVGLRLTKIHRLKLKLFYDKEIDGDGDSARVASVAYTYRY